MVDSEKLAVSFARLHEWLCGAEDRTRNFLADGRPFRSAAAGPRPTHLRHWPLITILSQQTDHPQRRHRTARFMFLPSRLVSARALSWYVDEIHAWLSIVCSHRC